MPGRFLNSLSTVQRVISSPVTKLLQQQKNQLYVFLIIISVAVQAETGLEIMAYQILETTSNIKYAQV